MNSFDCECCGVRNRLFEDPVNIDAPFVHELPFDRTFQRAPGGPDAPDAIEALAETVESFVDNVFEDIPEDALELLKKIKREGSVLPLLKLTQR